MGASLTLFRTVAMPRELVNWQLVIMELSPQSHHPHVITSVHVLVLLKMMASLMSLRTVVMQRRLAWILGVTAVSISSMCNVGRCMQGCNFYRAGCCYY